MILQIRLIFGPPGVKGPVYLFDVPLEKSQPREVGSENDEILTTLKTLVVMSLRKSMPPFMCQSALRLVASHRIAVCCRTASPWTDEAHSEDLER